MTESAGPVRVMEETSAYWRVVFDYPPFNIVDATIFEALQDLLARMDLSRSRRGDVQPRQADKSFTPSAYLPMWWN